MTPLKKGYNEVSESSKEWVNKFYEYGAGRKQLK